jgi:hypothetical protein
MVVRKSVQSIIQLKVQLQLMIIIRVYMEINLKNQEIIKARHQSLLIKINQKKIENKFIN